MNRRLVRCAALVGAVLLAVSGCASNAAGGGGGSNTLKAFFTSTDRPSEEAVIKLFEQQNPGVTVNASYADTDQFQSTLRTQLTSGTAPDVFSAWPGNGNAGAMAVLAPAGYLADLSNMSWVSQLPASMRSVTQYNGKTYVFPMAFSGIGAFYNKQALQDINGGKEPQTWSDVLALCDAAKAKGKVAFALGNATPWITQLIDYALVPTLVYRTDPNFDQQMRAGQASFANSGWQDAMNKYLEMNQRGCFNKNPNGTSYPDSLTEVERGDAVAVVQVTNALALLKQQAPQVQYGMFPLPATDNPADTWMPGAAGSTFAINAKAKNMPLARKFLEFLGTPQARKAYAEAAGGLPSIPDPNVRIDPALQPLVDHQKNGTTVPFMDQLWPNPKVQQVHFAVVQQLFSGQLTVPQALAQMDAAYKQQ